MILNRVATATETGVEYEADQSHAEVIVRDFGLGDQNKGVVTPGVSVSEKEEEKTN